jgi:hypothetical protein
VDQANFGRRVWRPAHQEAGTDFTLYDLRHTFTSTLSSAGVPDAEISLYSGHQAYGERSLENTMSRIYKHATGEWLVPSIEAVTGYLERALAVERERRAAIQQGKVYDPGRRPTSRNLGLSMDQSAAIFLTCWIQPVLSVGFPRRRSRVRDPSSASRGSCKYSRVPRHTSAAREAWYYVRRGVAHG